MISSAYLGSISMLCLSLSITHSVRGGSGFKAYARYSMKSNADRQSPWQIPIVVRMSLPVLLPIFTFSITSFRSRYIIICSSPGVKMLSRSA